MLSAISIGASLGFWSAFPLTFSLLVVPACGVFFWIDAKAVHEWRSKTLASWVRCEIDLGALSQAIRANPLLPMKTAAGMLETLPWAAHGTTDPAPSPKTREVIAAIITDTYEQRARLVALKTAGALIIIVAIIATASQKFTYFPLLAIVVGLLPFVSKWTKRRRAKRLQLMIETASADPDFCPDTFAQVISTLE
jgi:hypothetical protein